MVYPYTHLFGFLQEWPGWFNHIFPLFVPLFNNELIYHVIIKCDCEKKWKFSVYIALTCSDFNFILHWLFDNLYLLFLECTSTTWWWSKPDFGWHWFEQFGEVWLMSFFYSLFYGLTSDYICFYLCEVLYFEKTRNFWPFCFLMDVMDEHLLLRCIKIFQTIPV